MTSALAARLPSQEAGNSDGKPEIAGDPTPAEAKRLMLAPSTTVSAVVDLDLLDDEGGTSPVHAELRYDSADPFAVRGDFSLNGQVVRWVFARTLLRTGLYEPAGDGDVRVRPWVDEDGRAIVLIELRSPGGEATMRALSGDLAAFLRRTETLVAAGCESTHIDLDATLERLLQDDPA